jgi:hypothetical protein
MNPALAAEGIPSKFRDSFRKLFSQAIESNQDLGFRDPQTQPGLSAALRGSHADSEAQSACGVRHGTTGYRTPALYQGTTLVGPHKTLLMRALAPAPFFFDSQVWAAT